MLTAIRRCMCRAGGDSYGLGARRYLSATFSSRLTYVYRLGAHALVALDERYLLVYLDRVWSAGLVRHCGQGGAILRLRASADPSCRCIHRCSALPPAPQTCYRPQQAGCQHALLMERPSTGARLVRVYNSLSNASHLPVHFGRVFSSSSGTLPTDYIFLDSTL
jgi:hypothetical protein